MSEEHKTERTRNWQPASPAMRCSVLSLSPRQQLSVSCLHGEDHRHRWRSLWAQGRLFSARGDLADLLRTQINCCWLRTAHGGQWGPKGPKRWDPPRNFWKDPLGRAGMQNATHSPSFSSFNLSTGLMPM